MADPKPHVNPWIECPECEAERPATALECPHCGHAFANGERSAAAMLCVARAVRFPSTYHHALLHELIGHADRETGQCFPGTTRLERRTSMSRSQVKKCRKALAEAGLVTVTPQASGDGHGAHRYTLFPALLPRPPPEK